MAAATHAHAAVKIPTDGNHSITIGGLFQLQFKSNRSVDEDTTRSFTARRLRLQFDASFEKDWLTALQIDFGQASFHPSVLDAYLRYSGFSAGTLTVGNQNAPFSRERLTGAAYLQTPERAFTGSKKYGVPGRQPGIEFAGSKGFVGYSAGLYKAGIYPDTSDIYFESPFNPEGQYTGPLYTVRVELTPMGTSIPFRQTDLRELTGLTLGLNAYHWSNDESKQSANPGSDWNTLKGYGIDAAWRGNGVSADAGYNWVSGEARSSTITTGIIQNGSTRLTAWMLKGGYMVLPRRLEVFISTQGMSTEAWEAQWRRSIAGVNYFLFGYDLKLQFAIDHDSNENGVPGVDTNIIYLRIQQVF